MTKVPTQAAVQVGKYIKIVTKEQEEFTIF